MAKCWKFFTAYEYLLSKNLISKRENQQERYLYAYLAGIIDGEGTISIQSYFDKKTNRVRLTPFISIANSSVALIEKCKEIMQQERIIGRNYWYKGRGTNKPTTDLRVDGAYGVSKLLALIFDFLIVKKEQAIILMKYIESRRQKAIIRQENGRIKRRRPYSDKEMNMLFLIKSLNTGKSSETIRQTFINKGRYSPNLLETVGDNRNDCPSQMG